MRLALVALMMLAACGGEEEAKGTGREPDEYLGCAPDELWPTFDVQRAAAATDAATAPTLIAPDVAATLPKETAPIFSWLKKPGATATPDGDVPSSCAQWTRGAIDTQHLPPISGTAYDLELTVAGAATYRVITTLERWKPPVAAWQALAGKTVTLTIWEMPIKNNDLNGTVTKSTPVVFSVAN